MQKRLVLGLATLLFSWLSVERSYAFEDTKTLPKGVRRITLHQVHTQFDSKTNGDKSSTPLASKLEKSVTLNDFLNVRTGLAKTQLEAFMLANDLDKSSEVGSFRADIKAGVNVYAPTFAYGISDKLNLGFAVPVFDARTSTDLAFHPGKNSEKFVNLLAKPKVGQTARVKEAVEAINNVKATFNEKLVDNGYDEIDDWHATGLGDILVKGKYRTLSYGKFSAAQNFGVVVPTGRTDDPDNLTDIPFGDGTWDPFWGVSFDQRLGNGFFLNEFGTYTHQLPSKRKIRMRTEAEPIAVNKQEVSYKLGDKIDAGTSVQLETQGGFQGGLGYVYFHKFKDNYNASESSALYEEDTTETDHVGETYIGYSSVNAFQSGKAKVPYSASVTYLRQLQSQNRPEADQLQLDWKVYF